MRAWLLIATCGGVLAALLGGPREASAQTIGGAEPVDPGTAPPQPPTTGLTVSTDDEGTMQAGSSARPVDRKIEIDGPAVTWNDDWPRFQTWEYVVTGTAVASTFGSLAIPPNDGRWNTRNDFDTGARDIFRLRSRGDRQVARDASDFFLIGLSNQLVIDTLIVTWWGHGAPDVSLEMFLMSVEALTINSAINGLVAGLSARQRPNGFPCESVPSDEETSDCNGSRRYRSFFSGHSSTAFTAAGLTCMHHSYLELYGGGAPEALVCASSFAAAGAVASLRVMADQHWVSDIVVGASVGTAIGLGVPYFFHYSGGAKPTLVDDADSGVQLNVMPTPTGGMLMGRF